MRCQNRNSQVTKSSVTLSVQQNNKSSQQVALILNYNYSLFIPTHNAEYANAGLYRKVLLLQT